MNNKKKNWFINQEKLEFVLKTTSVSSTFRANNISKTGSSLLWTVTGGTTGSYLENQPFIDLSGNTGVAIITITSADNLLGFTYFRMVQSLFLLQEVKVGTAIDMNDFRLSSNVNVKGLKGITDLVKLKHLEIFSNGITTIDLSQNSLLNFLSINNNNLSVLDITNQTLLTDLRCSNNQLTQLDISTNPALTYLDFSANLIETIDLSNNPNLETIIFTNIMTNIDVSAVTNLNFINSVYNSVLLTINGFSGKTNLDRVYLFHSTALTSIDLSNSSVKDLRVDYCSSLSVLNLTNCISLWSFNCIYSYLTTVDLSSCTLLTVVSTTSSNLSISTINTIMIQLDNNGLSNGTFTYSVQPTVTEIITNDVLDAYNSLIVKGWSITGNAPI